MKTRQALPSLIQHCSEAGFMQIAEFAIISGSTENCNIKLLSLPNLSSVLLCIHKLHHA
jgi:hypothetical protein